MNFFSTPQIQNIRMTQTTTQITHQSEFQSIAYGSHNMLSVSNTTSSQSRINPQQNSLKPTKSKALITSYLNKVNKQKKVSFQKVKEHEQRKQQSVGKTKKLTLISNTKDKSQKETRDIRETDKQNRSSRANSKQKLHLTTLHPNIPVLQLSSKLDNMKQNMLSQRDMFLNISITNQSEMTQREQIQMRSKIQSLENQLSMVNQSLMTAKINLQSRQSKIMECQCIIDNLNTIVQSKNRQIKQLELQVSNKSLLESRTIEQKYELMISQRNQKTNQVVLQYQNQISELKQQIRQAMKYAEELKLSVQNTRLYENLNNINTNKIIKQLELKNQSLENHIFQLKSQYEKQKGDLIKRMQEKIENCKQQHASVISNSKLKQEQFVINIQSLTKERQTLLSSLQALKTRNDLIQTQSKSICRQNQQLCSQLESISQQLQILKKLIESTNQQKDFLKSQIINSSKVIEQTSRINSQYQTKQKIYGQVQNQLARIKQQNQQLVNEVNFLSQQRVKQQRLIFKIQESIEHQLEQQKINFVQEYKELEERYLRVCEQLDKYKNKRRMQKAIIQQSNHFYQQIYSKCQQIYKNSN